MTLGKIQHSRYEFRLECFLSKHFNISPFRVWMAIRTNRNVCTLALEFRRGWLEAEAENAEKERVKAVKFTHKSYL